MRQQALNGRAQLARLGRRRESVSHSAVSVDQKFGEVPLDLFGSK
jgi:hypothetical protein